jgi:NADPH-dependent glutamate synthase beta subunit-like oxidoreductase
LVSGRDADGIQASIHLANAGFRVYLADGDVASLKSQLKKAFPTRDCATCALAANIIEGYAHEGIRVLSPAEVAELRSILEGPSAEDLAASCAVKSEIEQARGEVDPMHLPLAREIHSLRVVDPKAQPPCTAACPVGKNVQGFVALIAQGRFQEAADLIADKDPLFAICSRVCPHPCEQDCNRGNIDEAIAISSLERFVADNAPVTSMSAEPSASSRGQRVAIVGSGPAGLAAAHDLAKMGYGVVIFEAHSTPGGMLALGIPEYRLPRHVLQAQIEAIRALGVELRLNSQVGEDGLTLNDLREEGYAAVFVATGAHVGKRLNIPGEDLPDVRDGVSFLRDANLGGEVAVGERVCVIGGGNVAIDAARVARRLGAREALIVYRRSREEMLASVEEIEEAEREGVKIRYLASPVRIMESESRAVAVEFVRNELADRDDSERRRPLPVPGSEFLVEVDMVISAIGQEVDVEFLPNEESWRSLGKGLQVDPTSLATGAVAVFIGGDAATGPSTVIEAVAAGRKAAVSIDNYLQGRPEQVDEERLPVVTIGDLDLRGLERASRVAPPTIPPEERLSSFAEVDPGLSLQSALKEASRCLACSRTLIPRQCVILCCSR